MNLPSDLVNEIFASLVNDGGELADTMWFDLPDTIWEADYPFDYGN